MVAVVEQLGGALGESGLLVLPCIAAHLNQVILDFFNFWVCSSCLLTRYIICFRSSLTLFWWVFGFKKSMIWRLLKFTWSSHMWWFCTLKCFAAFKKSAWLLFSLSHLSLVCKIDSKIYCKYCTGFSSSKRWLIYFTIKVYTVRSTFYVGALGCSVICCP